MINIVNSQSNFFAANYSCHILNSCLRIRQSSTTSHHSSPAVFGGLSLDQCICKSISVACRTLQNPLLTVYGQYHPNENDTFSGPGVRVMSGNSLEVVFTTASGLLGRGLPCLCKGDFIVNLYGLYPPILLRPISRGFTLHGLVEVAGIMRGELDTMIKALIAQNVAFERDFDIV